MSKGAGWIDVRDVALAHVLAAQKEGAGGERVIVSTGALVPGVSKASREFEGTLWYR